MPGENSKNTIIIGSGIGGMSCAIILLKLGYNVTIIEKNSLPGGLMRSYKRHGIHCPVGIHYFGSFDKGQPLRKIFDFLGISGLPVERMGVNNPIDKYFFDDFTFDFPEGLEAYRINLYKNFPGEKSAIDKIIGYLKRVENMLNTLNFPFFNNEKFSNLDLFKPLGEILSDLNCSPNLKAVLEVPCSWIGVPLSECPAIYHHTVLLSYLLSSWRLRCTGAGMADLFTSKILELGGNLITNNEAEAILTKERAVSGVRLKSGNCLKSDTVIAAIHPKSMLKILQEFSVKPAYINRINSITETPGMFSVHLGIDAGVHTELPYNIFKLQKNPDGSLAKIVFLQLRKSNNPEISIMTIITSSDYEQWIKWEKTKSGNRGKEYLLKKNNITENLINIASDVLGPLKNYKIIDSYSPLSIRDWVNTPEGSAYGVLRSKNQLIKTASLYRTSVKGLFLTGQNVLAPGLLGTMLGTLTTLKSVIGADLFQKEVLEKINASG